MILDLLLEVLGKSKKHFTHGTLMVILPWLKVNKNTSKP